MVPQIWFRCAVIVFAAVCLPLKAAAWETIDPVAAGFEDGLAATLDARYERGDFTNLHSLVVVRYGKLVLERYYSGADERWGSPIGNVNFDAGTLHDLRSISKSITSLLYGIALADGLVPPLDAPVLDSFPGYADLAADAGRRAVTVAHMLTMTPGLAWNEDVPYNSLANSEIAMENASDRYRYVLGRPLVTEPGTQWTYSGGTTAVLGHLIEKGTGRGLLEYANEKLFEPLGIDGAEWTSGLNGRAAAASGVRLRPRDLARIGQMIVDGGGAGGRQIVPAHWLAASFEKHASTGDDSYGYQWWLGDMSTTGKLWIAGIGLGGQRLIVVPSEHIVVVLTAGNYNKPAQWQVPRAIVTEVLLPAMHRHE